MNILFTCAGRRTYLLKYFKEEIKNEGLIIGADLSLTAPALSVADVKIQLPRVYAEDYIEKVLEICRQYSIDLLISLNDLELPILSKSKALFERIGVKLMVSELSVIDICFDKYKTQEFVKKCGLQSPASFLKIENTIEAFRNGSLKFPLILKPRWGSGSIGVEIVEDLEELQLAYRLLKKKVRRSILCEVSKGEDDIIIQQMVDGTEYGLDIINDLEGRFQSVVVKKKLAMRSGETDKAITVDNAGLRNIGKIISEELHHVGNLDCDVLERNGQYFVIDLNPRFGGGYPFSHQAGVNLPKALIEWSKGNSVNTNILEPKFNVGSAKCDYLVMI